MKILYITTNFEQKNSSAAIRNNALVNGFIGLGHTVTVLTPKWPTFVESDFLKQQNRAKIIHSIIPALNLLKYTSKDSSKKKNRPITIKIRRFIRDIIYFPDICKNWKNAINVNELDNNFDIIISSSDLKSSHYVAKSIKKHYPELKWIQIWGDPWADDVNMNIILKPFAKRGEENLIKSADRIIYISELTKSKIISQYPKEKDKISFVPRSYFSEIPKTTSGKKEISIIYPGILAFGRNIEILAQCIEKYNSGNGEKICLKLFGEYDLNIQNTLSRYKAVQINESVEYEKILNLFSQEDVLLFISNSAKSTQIPGKLFDYMGTQLPVICLVNSYADPITKVLKSFKRCVVTENSEIEIMKTLSHISEIASTKFSYDLDYSPQKIARDILKLLE